MLRGLQRLEHVELAWLPRYEAVAQVLDSEDRPVSWRVWICGVDGGSCEGLGEPDAGPPLDPHAPAAPRAGRAPLLVPRRLDAEEAIPRAEEVLQRTARVMKLPLRLEGEIELTPWRVPVWLGITRTVWRSWHGSWGLRAADATEGRSLSGPQRQALLSTLLEDDTRSERAGML